MPEFPNKNTRRNNTWESTMQNMSLFVEFALEIRVEADLVLRLK